MEKVTVFQKLQDLTVLGPLDETGLAPRVMIDASGMQHAITTLWRAVAEQRETLTLMEKEASRKRTEQDVKISNMQNEFDSKLQAEARRRSMDDDKLRAELQKLRDELTGVMDGLKSDMGNLEGSMSTSLEATIAQLKIAVAQAQQKASDAIQRANALEETTAGVQRDLSDMGKRVDGELERLNSVTENLHKIWSFDARTVAAAVEDRRCTELMLETPPLAQLVGRLNGFDDKLGATRREIAATNVTIQDLAKRTTATETDVFKLKGLPERVAEMDTTLRRTIETEVSKLRELIEALSNKPTPAAVPQVVAADSGAVQDALNRAYSLIAALDERVTEVERVLATKADRADLEAFATKADLDALAERLSGLAPRPAELAPSAVPAAPLPRDNATAGALLSLKDTVDALARRLGQLEKEWADGKEAFATREELRDACHDTLKAAEAAINHIYDELRRMIKSSNAMNAKLKEDATAGRFRCLSCNRDAGPLSEAVRERLSKSQFPPSSTLLSRDARDSPPRLSAAGRGYVPGGKDGQQMTSSRRKLQNYYDWLQTKEGEDSTRKTTPPRTVYLGSQSGGGGPGRQSGDHGSDDPDAIGADGKYYVGVVSRPTSSAGHRPRSAPLHRADAGPAKEPPAKPRSPAPPPAAADAGAEGV